jgi:FtsP/CotA-like multicopper oxidase with cupredoxin domain
MVDLDRRSLLRLAALAPLARFAPLPEEIDASATQRPDTVLRISRRTIELGPGRRVSTTVYNDQFPGPLLRFREGERVTVDIQNDTDTPEQVHWHGQLVGADVDGAAEEGTPFVPAHGMRRISFVPRPAGFRFVHTHLLAGSNLTLGTYSGQSAPVYIEPRTNAGRYDREVFIVLKEFEPSLQHGGDMASDMLTGSADQALQAIGRRQDQLHGGPKGFEVSYRIFSINGRARGAGEPVRVRQGERVLFHVLNASATEIRSLALPRHTFTVVALDGNPVPTQASVPVLWVGTAERVSAVVEMNDPGVWLMGDVSDDDREHGLGIVVEYAGKSGTPVWTRPPQFRWDYASFGNAGVPAASADETIEITIAKQNGADRGFNRWTLNGQAFSSATKQPSFTLHRGRRYRLRFRNASDDIHPLHLHRHTFELTRVGGKPTSGVLKDVVMVGGFQEVELDFVADNPGPTLFHCHQQLHMDFGFMALFEYA